MMMVLIGVFITAVFATGIYVAEVGDDAINDLYNERLVPILQIKSISDSYSEALITTVSKSGDNVITWEEGRRRTSEAQKKIASQWKAYLGTDISPAERQVLAEIRPLMIRADKKLAELRALFDGGNRADLKRFSATTIYQDIDPLLSKLSALAAVEQAIADRKHLAYEAAYRKGRYYAAILMVVSFLSIGTLVESIIRRLLRDLGAEPAVLRKIAESVAGGDLSLTVPVDDNNRTGVHWALKVMAVKLRELISQKDKALEYAESIVDTLREAMVVLDSDLKVLSANRNFYETFSVTPADTIEQYIYDLGNGQWKMPALQLLLEDILANDTVINGYEVVHNFPGIGRKTIMLNARQVFSTTVGTHIILLAMEDISERKEAEDEIRKLSRAVEQSPFTIMITDVLGAIEFVNPMFTTLTGYSAEEAVGQNPRVLKSGLTPPETHQKLWSTITAGKIWEGEFLNKSRDGSLFWEYAKISPLRDETGTITHFLAVKEDITEKKSVIEQLVVAREQADAANRAKSDFLAIMSHEIRTPMNGVIGMSSILLETDLNPEQREYAEIVSRSGENLLVLINDILDFSKIEAGKLELDRANFDLRLLLDDIDRLLAYRAGDAGIALTYTIEDGMPKILHGDAGRVRQVITNLVGNALKFTKQGAVAVNTSLVSDQNNVVTVKFSISDTGIGIPESRLSAIFTPFTQVDTSTTRKYGGTGLGLTICRQLAELMGGEIGVTSEEGKGSTFWFTARFEKQNVETVKAAQEAAPNALPVAPRAAASLNDLTARILLVEDNAINQKVALHQLKMLGYSADVAADGQEAVDALSMTNYDLVLMDCLMPNMSGFQATTIIRDQSSAVLNHNVPVIAMTANAMNEDRDNCLEAGMDDYVSKPVKKELLDALLKKWLSPANLLRKKAIDVGEHDLDKLKQLKVLYVEDDDDTRGQYSQFLSRIVGVLITARDGAEGLAAYNEHHPDIIITDIKMPVMDGLEMLKLVRTHNTSLPAIVFSAFEISDDQKHSLNLGLRKPATGTKLETALFDCANSLLERGTLKPTENDLSQSPGTARNSNG